MNYHTDLTELTCSQLKEFHKDRQRFYDLYLTQQTKKPSTWAMTRGTIVHAVLLEGTDLDKLVARYPDECYGPSGTHFKKDGSKESFEAQCKEQGIHCVSEAQLSNLVSICNSPGARKVRQQIQGCATELLHTNPSYRTKCRVDATDGTTIFDLKITSPYEDDFTRTASQLHYWIQAVHYCKTACMDDLIFMALDPEWPDRYRTFRFHNWQRFVPSWEALVEGCREFINNPDISALET